MPATLIDLLTCPDPADAVHRAVALLDEGKLVVVPTETVYGIAGRLDLPGVIDRLEKFRTSSSGPFTLHVESMDDALSALGTLKPMARKLMRKLWPGPVALTMDVTPEQKSTLLKSTALPESALLAGNTLTMRCPDNVATGAILGMTEGPVGLVRVPGESGDRPDWEKVSALLGDDVALILTMGPTRFAKPSTIVRVNDNDYTVTRPGVFDERIIERQLKSMILFVCSGNTCRSPMAAAVARKLIADKLKVVESDLEAMGILVQSAGTFAMPGVRATPQAVIAAQSLGADLASHRSRALSLELINQADHIFTMGRSHAETVLGISASAQSRVEPMDPSGDVEDPIGGDVSLYTELANSFAKLLEPRLNSFLADIGHAEPPTENMKP